MQKRSTLYSNYYTDEAHAHPDPAAPHSQLRESQLLRKQPKFLALMVAVVFASCSASKRFGFGLHFCSALMWWLLMRKASIHPADSSWALACLGTPPHCGLRRRSYVMFDSDPADQHYLFRINFLWKLSLPVSKKKKKKRKKKEAFAANVAVHALQRR